MCGKGNRGWQGELGQVYIVTAWWTGEIGYSSSEPWRNHHQLASTGVFSFLSFLNSRLVCTSVGVHITSQPEPRLDSRYGAGWVFQCLEWTGKHSHRVSWALRRVWGPSPGLINDLFWLQHQSNYTILPASREHRIAVYPMSKSIQSNLNKTMISRGTKISWPLRRLERRFPRDGRPLIVHSQCLIRPPVADILVGDKLWDNPAHRLGWI